MSTYAEDFVVWSEHQAALLRRMAAGEAVNESPDWPNIIEEIESLGRSERHALRRQISRVLEHLIALAASPATDPHRGWKLTIINAQAEMRKLLRDTRVSAANCLISSQTNCPRRASWCVRRWRSTTKHPRSISRRSPLAKRRCWATMSNRKPEDPRREAAARAIDMPAGAIADRTQRAQRAHTAAGVQSAGGIDFTSLQYTLFRDGAGSRGGARQVFTRYHVAAATTR